jgi:membrane fusion protein (multidrug efflux system)
VKALPRKHRWLIAVVVVVIALVLGFFYWLHARHYVSTDDAFINGHSVKISPRISGQVMTVAIRDNQLVHKGDVLVKLDPGDYQAKVNSARADLNAAQDDEQAAKADLELTRVTTGADVAQAQSALQGARSSVQQAKANVDAAKAKHVRTRADRKRFQVLYKKKETSLQHLQQVVAEARSAKAQWQAAQHQVAASKAKVREAEAKLKSARSAPKRVKLKKARLENAKASVEQARAELETAKLNLSYTVIRAPRTGHITKKSVVAGDTVKPGQILTSLVYGTPWVKANFKETDLTHMHPGQSVKVSVDAYPDVTFDAHVQSIQRGTGSHFSLLPPENATGNFVKVVQRVPVKIVFDNPPGEQYVLSLGMSVEPEVHLTQPNGRSSGSGQ